MLPPELDKPPHEGEIIEPEIATLERDAPPIEEVVARAPIEREMRQVQSERDFDALDDMVAFKLDAYAPPGSQEGYFRLQILPRAGQEIAPLPKDVTFVVDASKSISQPKLNATTAGLKQAITQLRPEDRFNVVVFRDSPTPFQPAPVPATPTNMQAATNFVNQLSATGQTNVYEGIHPVIAQVPRPGAPSIVVVLSDGRPTTGMLDGRTIINGLTADNDLRNSIFAFAGGRTVNRYLLDLLAYRNKGEAHVVDAVGDIPSALPAFFLRYQDPLLIDLRADFGRIDETQVFPQIVPDFFRDRAVTVYGRYDRTRDTDFFMRLTGQAEGRTKELIFRTDLDTAATGDASIARNWAFQKSYHLIGQIVTQGETPELLAELRRLESEYNIRTSYSE
jgi:Ca-activated chloride channel family protein